MSSTTMPATLGHNEACCNIPPVVATGYKPKGAYEELDGYKTYVTGSSEAAKGIVSIFDIFGYTDQTLQGADILAEGDNNKYKVFVPDWFEGQPCPIDIYPPNTPEKQARLGAFFAKYAPSGAASRLPGLVKALSAANPQIASWGVVGFCWGGKAVSLVTSDAATNPFTAAASCHPGMLEPAEAAGIKVPLIMLASGEEPDDKVREYERALTGPKHVETFKDQVHGWMAARADLKDERVKAEYARGYKTVLGFFGKHWA